MAALEPWQEAMNGGIYQDRYLSPLAASGYTSAGGTSAPPPPPPGVDAETWARILQYGGARGIQGTPPPQLGGTGTTGGSTPPNTAGGGYTWGQPVLPASPIPAQPPAAGSAGAGTGTGAGAGAATTGGDAAMQQQVAAVRAKLSQQVGRTVSDPEWLTFVTRVYHPLHPAVLSGQAKVGDRLGPEASRAWDALLQELPPGYVQSLDPLRATGGTLGADPTGGQVSPELARLWAELTGKTPGGEKTQATLQAEAKQELDKLKLQLDQEIQRGTLSVAQADQLLRQKQQEIDSGQWAKEHELNQMKLQLDQEIQRGTLSVAQADQLLRQKQQQINQELEAGKLTGSYGGQDTLEKMKADREWQYQQAMMQANPANYALVAAMQGKSVWQQNPGSGGQQPWQAAATSAVQATPQAGSAPQVGGAGAGGGGLGGSTTGAAPAAPTTAPEPIHVTLARQANTINAGRLRPSEQAAFGSALTAGGSSLADYQAEAKKYTPQAKSGWSTANWR